MLSTTPPGHWIQIALQVSDAARSFRSSKRVDLMARLGVATADAFITCWRSKFGYETVRPFNYIRAHIDPDFTPLLITPPFPEYPSGHSVQSGAAVAVLGKALGESFAYDDAAHVARRPAAAPLRELCGGGGGGGDVARLWRHPFPLGRRAGSRAGALRRPLRQRAEDRANEARSRRAGAWR